MDLEPLLGGFVGPPRCRRPDGVQLTPYNYPRPRRRDPARHSVARLFAFCLACVGCLLLMYIPVYNTVNRRLVMVPGWSEDTNRDPRIYVQPENNTLKHDPKTICEQSQQPLFLLIVVCSATDNFKRRQLIRETWGDANIVSQISKTTKLVRENYKNYKFDYDLIEVENVTKAKRRLMFNFMKIAELLKEKDVTDTDLDEEKKLKEENKLEEVEKKSRFEPDIDDFEETKDFEEDYGESNVMRIPPRGEETDNPSLEQVLALMKKTEINKESVDSNVITNENINFKLIFLVGLPVGENSTEVQKQIDEESTKHGDIVQESFHDTYYNLTLKSVMMLKWVVTHCDEKVRYVLKADDDVLVNVPRLIEFVTQQTAKTQSDYYIAGSLIKNAVPVVNVNSKWYSPHYMFPGRIYPRYLSGPAYVMTYRAARSLYAAALRTPLFHLEDVFITGMCSARASPRLKPTHAAGFYYERPGQSQCDAYNKISAHRIDEGYVRDTVSALSDADIADRCERELLQEIRNKQKTKDDNKIAKAIKKQILKLVYPSAP